MPCVPPTKETIAPDFGVEPVSPQKRYLAYNEDEQYQSVFFNRAFPSLYKKLDEQES